MGQGDGLQVEGVQSSLATALDMWNQRAEGWGQWSLRSKMPVHPQQRGTGTTLAGGGEQQMPALGGWTWDRFFQLVLHFGWFLLAILRCTRGKHTTFLRGIVCFKNSLLPAHQCSLT